MSYEKSAQVQIIITNSFRYLQVVITNDCTYPFFGAREYWLMGTTILSILVAKQSWFEGSFVRQDNWSFDLMSVRANSRFLTSDIFSNHCMTNGLNSPTPERTDWNATECKMYRRMYGMLRFIYSKKPSFEFAVGCYKVSHDLLMKRENVKCYVSMISMTSQTRKLHYTISRMSLNSPTHISLTLNTRLNMNSITK